MLLYRTKSSTSRQTKDLILSGRSFIKVRNRIGPKTDLWDTRDDSETGSEACSSNTTCPARPKSHEKTYL